MPIVRYPQERADEEIRAQAAALEDLQWPPQPFEKRGVFPVQPHTHVTSFLLIEDKKVTGHIAVRKAGMRHKGIPYWVLGLSEVVVHPLFRNRGYGTALLRAAARFMSKQGADLSLFTCTPHLTAFYTKGGWSPAPDACLVGGTRQKPFRSDRLGLVTMMRLYSDKANAHSGQLRTGDLFIPLGENQLW